MAFQRKWVSDTNLSKLLHETIEKKEANKQRRSPDFCKDAMLSATIKKISSAMSHIFPRTVVEKEERAPMDLDEKDVITENWGCGLSLDDLKKSDDEKDSWEKQRDISMVIDNISTVNIAFEIEKGALTSCRSDEQILKENTCGSPKRKRHSSLEGNEYCKGELVHRSPHKRRKRKEKKLGHVWDGLGVDGEWESDDEFSSFNSIKNKQRSQSLPYLVPQVKRDSQKIVYREKKYPVKSVVNSISELSITDCWGSNTNGSWCLADKELEKSDPLELNDFFHELKSVTSSS